VFNFRSALPLLIALFSWPIFAQAPSHNLKLEEAASLRAFNGGEYEKSRDGYMNLTRLSPENGVYWFNLGNSHYMLGDFAEAAAAYDKTIEIKSELAKPAALFKAKSLRKLGAYDEARSALAGIDLATLPERLRAGFAAEARKIDEEAAAQEDARIQGEAWEFYKQEKYLEALDKIKETKNYSADTYFFETLVLIKLESFEAAKEAYGAGARMALNDDDRDTARELSELLAQQRERRKKYSLSTDTYFGHSSNIYSEPRGDDPNQSYRYGISATGILRNKLTRTWDWNARYSVAYSEITQDTTLSAMHQTLFFPIEFSGAELLFRVGPQVEHESWGGKSAVTKVGLRLKAAYSSERLDVGLEGDWAEQNPQSSQLGYLDGPAHHARIYFGWLFDRLYAQVSFLRYEEEGGSLITATGTLPLAHRGQGAEVQLDWNILKKRLIWSHVFSYTGKKYSGLAQPGDIRRSDYLMSVLSKLTLTVSNRDTFYLGGEWVQNDSTLSDPASFDKDYRTFLWSVGWTWELQ
jgi:tetratricopeptide (TPR) repeat protein